MNTTRTYAVRKLSFDAGHRLHNHESKCAHMHGHTYSVELFAEAIDLDNVGRVIDFGVLKDTFKRWLDEYWDHGFLYSKDDAICSDFFSKNEGMKSFVMNVNPTAENMAEYLLVEVAPYLLKDVDVRITKIILHETANCRAEVSLLGVSFQNHVKVPV